MTIPAITPEQASTEPTERSKCPDARQKSMVQAAIPTVEIARPRPRMFSGDMKLSMNTAHSRKIPTAARSITQSSAKRRRFMP
ncbi:hypothetical protein PSYPI_30718 [Pseudomonas syringae pv. pisi str. 1704B]|uniref:Uncharacterized protein n=1 Tax=Pseudomonas syringae pv. pisi str. 1704B TaxID=629263 RepID=F3GH97_PSESJ|nr:hypothetical protein PSYPI_30718 [Pseudomonas syringae pv. pisi str. 1704B]